MKPTYSFRLEKELVEKARKLGLNLTQVFEEKLAEIAKTKRCPACHQKIKAKR